MTAPHGGGPGSPRSEQRGDATPTPPVAESVPPRRPDVPRPPGRSAPGGGPAEPTPTDPGPHWAPGTAPAAPPTGTPTPAAAPTAAPAATPTAGPAGASTGGGTAGADRPGRSTSSGAGPPRPTVLPSGAAPRGRPVAAASPGSAGSGSATAPAARPAARSEPRGTAPAARPPSLRSRRARLALRRIDPWSVFVFSLISAVFLGIALVVAAVVLYTVLGSLGVTASLNQLWAEVTGGSTDEPLLTGGRIIGGMAVLAAVNVVLLTLLATLGSLLYNLCASFTGGLELTLAERE